MRKAYTMVLLATPILLAAQQGTFKSSGLNNRTLFEPGRNEQPPGERSEAVSLWTEDFENGLNGWTVETTQGPTDWTLTSTGNTNGYTPGPLESSTGFSHGNWILADSDEQGIAGHPENTSITSPVINGFDTVPYLLLRFEQSFRQLNNDRTQVEVSGNGGTDWTTYQVNHGIAGNESTPGAPASQKIVLNISSALTHGSGAILLRFRWISDQGYTYSWQVDDIDLLAVRPNDLVLHEATWASWNLDEPGYDGIPCTIYPLGETHELKFKGMIGNNGSVTQTNVQLRVDVSGPDGYATTLYSPTIDLAPGLMDSLFILDYEPPDVVGDYAFHLSVMQDQTDDEPVDNSIDQGIKVDAHLFARDEGQLTSVRANGASDYVLGNRFYMEGYGRNVVGVDVALGPGTEVGSVISAVVYDGYFHFVGMSDEHTVTAEEINDIGGETFITIMLPEPVELDNDRLYLACVFVEAANGPVFTGISGRSLPQTSMIYRADMETWYYTTNTPMVRMRLDDYFTGIGDQSLIAPTLQAFPSPFDERTTVTFTDEQGGTVAWDLQDATGRTVRTGTLGSQAPGERRINLNGDGLEEGIYVMTVTAGGKRSTVRIVRQARR